MSLGKTFLWPGPAAKSNRCKKYDCCGIPSKMIGLQFIPMPNKENKEIKNGPGHNEQNCCPGGEKPKIKITTSWGWNSVIVDRVTLPVLFTIKNCCDPSKGVIPHVAVGSVDHKQLYGKEFILSLSLSFDFNTTRSSLRVGCG